MNEDIVSEVFSRIDENQDFWLINGVYYPFPSMVYAIHSVLVSLFKGAEDEIRSSKPLHEANIEFAIESTKRAGEDIVDRKERLFTKAACLLQRLCTAHGFFDGNKRTAYVTFLLFLVINGFSVHVSMAAYEEHVGFLKRISNQQSGSQQATDEVLSWLSEQKLLFT